jgi:hypothetical protein
VIAVFSFMVYVLPEKGKKGGVMEKSRLIVMPFVPVPGRAFDGIGLGIHFLLGNLFGVHSGLTECWFGWRVKKIFQDGPAFSDYCRGRCSGPDIQGMGGKTDCLADRAVCL